MRGKRDWDRRTTCFLCRGSLSVLLVMTLAVSGNSAADWRPEKNVEIVVPTGPGSGDDTTARTVQKVMQGKKLVESVTVVNKPGGGGTISRTYLSQHPGDGHYLLVTSPTMLTNYITGQSSLSHTRFASIALLSTEYVVLAVREDAPIKSGKEAVARLKEDPNSYSIGLASSLGNPNHVAVAKVMGAAGEDPRKLKVVVFNSGGNVISALLGGHVAMISIASSVIMSHVAAGKVRVVGVTSPRRLGGALEQVPTWKEQGFDVVVEQWRAVIGPKGLSTAQIVYWDDVFSKLVKADDWAGFLEKRRVLNAYMNSRETRKFLDAQHDGLKAVLTGLELAKSK